MDTQAWIAKHAYFKALRKWKKEHWEDFLDDTKNIWQAAKYSSNQTGTCFFSVIARVKNGFGLQVTTSENIGNMLLKSFFPIFLPSSQLIVQTFCPRTFHIYLLPRIFFMLK